MSKFVDKAGMLSIIEEIKNKFVKKSEVPQKMWIGTKDQYNNIAVKDDQTLYFIKP